MKKPKKILLISLIVILVIWFVGNLGLYLFIKHFVIGEERLELINRAPQTIEIDYKKTEGKKIYFGDIEFNLQHIDFESVIFSPSIDITNKESIDYAIFLILVEKRSDKNSNMLIHLWNSDQKFAENFIGLSKFTLDKFSVWNIVNNYNLIADTAGKLLLLSNNADLEHNPLAIVKTKYLRGFWQINSREKYSSASLEISENGQSYSFHLFGSDIDIISDDMENIISSIKPIEDKEKIIKELTSKYQTETAIFEKELALISLISIEGPTTENLSELKKLFIKKGKKEYYIKDIQEQIDILSNIINKAPN